MRENKRIINRAIRELDREKSNLEKQEKKLVADIKKNAKANQMGAVKVLAKDLVRTRNYVTKFIEFRSHLQGVALKLEVVRSHEAMSSAMKDVTKAMVKLNKQVNVKSLQKIMVEFMKENERSELTGEMMGDAIDDALTEEGDAEAEEAIVGQVLDEIGINFDEAVPMVPVGNTAVSQSQETKQPVAAAVGMGAKGGGDKPPDNGSSSPPNGGADGGTGGGSANSGGGGDAKMSDLEARLNNLRNG